MTFFCLGALRNRSSSFYPLRFPTSKREPQNPRLGYSSLLPRYHLVPNARTTLRTNLWRRKPLFLIRFDPSTCVPQRCEYGAGTRSARPSHWLVERSRGTIDIFWDTGSRFLATSSCPHAALNGGPCLKRNVYNARFGYAFNECVASSSERAANFEPSF